MPVDYLNDTSQFDLARKRAQQASGASLQGRRDALQRRFAQLGNLDSGARLKMEQNLEQQGAQELQAANEGIDAQQAQEMGRRREILQGQEFARGEREAGQKFSGEQAAMQRAYLTGEREAGQKYGTGEREASQLFQGNILGRQQAFATGEREAGQKFASAERAGAQKFAARESAFGREQQAKQFDESIGLQREQMGLANQQFAESIRQFNAALEQQKYETEKSLQAQRNAGDKSFVGQVKSTGAQLNPTKWRR